MRALLGDHNRRSSGRSVPVGDETGGRLEQDSVGYATLAARPTAARTTAPPAPTWRMSA
jgi:hypothetical protein